MSQNSGLWLRSAQCLQPEGGHSKGQTSPDCYRATPDYKGDSEIESVSQRICVLSYDARTLVLREEGEMDLGGKLVFSHRSL